MGDIKDIVFAGMNKQKNRERKRKRESYDITALLTAMKKRQPRKAAA